MQIYFLGHPACSAIYPIMPGKGWIISRFTVVRTDSSFALTY